MVMECKQTKPKADIAKFCTKVLHLGVIILVDVPEVVLRILGDA